jgi:uncharacterized protein YcbX
VGVRGVLIYEKSAGSCRGLVVGLRSFGGCGAGALLKDEGLRIKEEVNPNRVEVWVGAWGADCGGGTIRGGFSGWATGPWALVSFEAGRKRFVTTSHTPKVFALKDSTVK